MFQDLFRSTFGKRYTLRVSPSTGLNDVPDRVGITILGNPNPIFDFATLPTDYNTLCGPRIATYLGAPYSGTPDFQDVEPKGPIIQKANTLRTQFDTHEPHLLEDLEARLKKIKRAPDTATSVAMVGARTVDLNPEYGIRSRNIMAYLEETETWLREVATNTFVPVPHPLPTAPVRFMYRILRITPNVAPVGAIDTDFVLENPEFPDDDLEVSNERIKRRSIQLVQSVVGRRAIKGYVKSVRNQEKDLRKEFSRSDNFTSKQIKSLFGILGNDTLTEPQKIAGITADPALAGLEAMLPHVGIVRDNDGPLLYQTSIPGGPPVTKRVIEKYGDLVNYHTRLRANTDEAKKLLPKTMSLPERINDLLDTALTDTATVLSPRDDYDRIRDHYFGAAAFGADVAPILDKPRKEALKVLRKRADETFNWLYLQFHYLGAVPTMAAVPNIIKNYNLGQKAEELARLNPLVADGSAQRPEIDQNMKQFTGYTKLIGLVSQVKNNYVPLHKKVYSKIVKMFKP